MPTATATRYGDDADGAAEEHDEQSLGKKLGFDVPFSCAESAAQTDLADAFVDGNQHDVHHANAADAECQDADKDQQYLQADGDAVDDRAELFAAKHLKGLFVGGRKLLARCDGGENLGFGTGLELWRDWFKDQNTCVLCVPEIVGRGVGDPSGLVVAREIIAQLDLAIHGADHGEADAADGHGFADTGASTEKLFAYARAEEDDTAAFQFVERVDPAAFGGLLVAHVSVFRADATDGRGADHTVSIGDAGAADGFETSVADVVGGLFDHVDVGLFEDNFFAGALAARLFAGLLWPTDDGAFAESVEAADENLTEAAAVSDQQGDGGNAPHDAEHGEGAARAIAAQGEPGFANDKSCSYPQPMLAAGLMAQGFDGIDGGGAARGIERGENRDGSEKARGTVPVCHVGKSPAKKSGMGNKSTKAQRPKASSRPLPPLIIATMSASRKN